MPDKLLEWWLHEIRKRLVLCPIFFACSFGVLLEIGVSVGKVQVDRCAAFFYRFIVAVVDDRFGQAAEYRFNNIEELGRSLIDAFQKEFRPFHYTLTMVAH